VGTQALAGHPPHALSVADRDSAAWLGGGQRYFGYTVRLFGLVPLPALAAKGTHWAEIAGDVHAVLTLVLLGVVGLHVAGGLYHRFVLKDRVLQRMLPGV
jgi:cytochrome b561